MSYKNWPDQNRTLLQTKEKRGENNCILCLFHYYRRNTLGLTEENKDDYTKKYGFLNGNRLFNDYKRLTDRYERIKEPKSKPTLNKPVRFNYCRKERKGLASPFPK